MLLNVPFRAFPYDILMNVKCNARIVIYNTTVVPLNHHPIPRAVAPATVAVHISYLVNMYEPASQNNNKQ